MTTFLAIAICLTILTAALLALPLLRHRAGAAPVTAVIVALLVPGATGLLYLFGSNYDWQAPPVQVEAAGAAGLTAAIAGLEARLQDEPGNLEGWLLLGESYLQTQRPDEAEAAFSRALQLSGGSNPQAKLGIAEARVVVNRAALAGEAGDLIEQALAELPDDPRALWYGGLAALARQDRDAVLDRWTRLLELNPPPQVASVIRQQITELGLETPSPQTGSAKVGGTAIDVSISVAESLTERIGKEAILFLAARDAVNPGPPLAAVRVPASGLPRTLNISDANAMMAGRGLSQADRIRLVARVSNAGTALPQPGDLFGEIDWRDGDGPVDIVIDQVVEQ